MQKLHFGSPVPLLTDRGLFDLIVLLRIIEQHKSLQTRPEESACREWAVASCSEGLSIGMLKDMLWLMWSTRCSIRRFSLRVCPWRQQCVGL
ncbi:hypothetical protein EMIT0196MI5_160120 [Pseudomonas sp. IT-196MI5]